MWQVIRSNFNPAINWTASSFIMRLLSPVRHILMTTSAKPLRMPTRSRDWRSYVLSTNRRLPALAYGLDKDHMAPQRVWDATEKAKIELSSALTTFHCTRKCHEGGRIFASHCLRKRCSCKQSCWWCTPWCHTVNLVSLSAKIDTCVSVAGRWFFRPSMCKL